MRRTFPVAGLFLAAAVAAAAPVPKDFDPPAKKVERLFGKTFQSPRATGGEFKFDAKGLTAKMPAAKFGNEASPHAGMHTQTLVTGDFEAEVSMQMSAPPLAKSIFLGGGLFARDPDKMNNVAVLIAQNLRGRLPPRNKPGGWVREVLAITDTNDDALDDEEAVDPTAPFHFRLTRKGDTFTTAVSADGKTWRALKPMKQKLPATVGVGVFCYNRTGEPADTRFEGFAIRPLK